MTVHSSKRSKKYKMDNDDCLEKRAKKHAYAMFEHNKTPTKVTDLTSLLSDEAAAPLLPQTDASTPKKRTREKKITPRKLVKEGSSSPLLKKGKQISRKISEKINVNNALQDAVDIGGTETSPSANDWTDTEEGTLDRDLTRKAKNINLSQRNVKSIIHHLLTNEHVIKLYKDVLSAQDADKTEESPVKTSGMGTLDSFPKMTRSKVKDFMEKSNIPPSPCKKQNSGPSILEVDFAEEEDDDEYSPEKDETNETDDDESVISSYLSEFGSPCPVTPSTPVPHISAERPSLSMSPSIVCSPLSTAQNRLKIDLSECEGLSETEDEGTIALRTRSKRSLMDTSLMDIEQAFIAPDITPDMYDTSYKDKDWTDFLNSLYKTNADESTVDDEVNDPEFNYIAEAEDEALDDEDFRFDKPTKVSKKELNALIEELHCLFEDEVLPLQVVAEASSNQDPISQLVSSNMKENPALVPVTRSQVVFPASAQKQQTPLMQSSHLTSMPFQNPQPSFSTSNEFNIMPSNSHVGSPAIPDSGFKVPLVPSQGQPISSSSHQSTEVLQSCLVLQSNVQYHQKLVIEDNIRKHIQLLTQTFLLSMTENCSNKMTVTKAATDMLTDLNTRKLASGSDSVMNACNLDWALQLVGDGSVADVGRDGSNAKNAMEAVKMTIFNNPTFMYTHLLPKLVKVKNRKRKSVKTRCIFIPSEDNLIALGLEQFSGCKGAFPSEFIHQYLMHTKSVNEIYHRVMYLSSSKAGINPVKKFLKLGQCVQLDPPLIHPIDFRPPRFKSFDVLPNWCQEFQRPQVSLRYEKKWQRDSSSFTPILPKGGLSNSYSRHSVTNSSLTVIPHRNRCVSNKTLSIRGNSRSRGKKDNRISSNFSVNPSASFESPNSGNSPLHIHDIHSKFDQSPDLLKKAMASCGINGFPSPNSSSTPVDKAKPTLVKNLASAFEESEAMNREQMQEANSDNIDHNSVSDMIGDSSSTGMEISKSSHVSESHGCRDSSLSSDLSAMSDSINKTSVDSETVKKRSEFTATPSNVPKDVASENEGIDHEAMLEDKNINNINKESGKTKVNVEPAKGNVIQLTVIEKPKFEKKQDVLKSATEPVVSSGKSERISEDKSGKISKKDSIITGEVPISVMELTTVIVEEKKDKVGDDGSSNKLVPWISSIYSQPNPEDSDPGSQKTTTPESGNGSDLPVGANKTSNPSGAPDVNFCDIPAFKSPELSPTKVALFSSPKRTPPKLHPIAPKTSPCPKSAPYIPLPRSSPKRKELNRQVRHILPKSFVFESKLPSPTKKTALSLKKKATLLCQKSPVKILPRSANIPANDRDVGIKTRGRSSMLTRSQRGISKPKRKEEPFHKEVKRVKRIEEDYESAKETESEASEFEESGLSQEEDEDRTKLDDLMAASTTIRFGSKPTTTDNDVKTKAERKKAMSLSLLQPDLVQNDPKKDDRDTAFAQQYFNQVKETLSSDPDRFYKFLSLLKDLNKDHTNPVELYLDMVSLLSDHQQLVEDFAGFLLSFQAVECQCFSTNFQYAQIRQFLRQVEVHCGSSTTTYRKVLKALSTWSSMCQEGKLEGGLREKMLAILKNVPGVLDNLISYFLDGAVSDCHAMDFEEINLDEEREKMNEGDDEFENIVLPDEPEDYNTKTCTCQCHRSNPQDDRYQQGIKHCVSCSLQVYEGRPVCKTSRYVTFPMSIVYPLEEEKLAQDKEKSAQAKIEAAQIVLAKAKVQQQQKEQRKRKGGLEFISSKTKRIRKQSEDSGGKCGSDSLEENSKVLENELSLPEKVDEEQKLKKMKGTGHTKQLNKKSSNDKNIKKTNEEKANISDQEDTKSRAVKCVKDKISKSNSKPEHLSRNQIEIENPQKGRPVDKSEENSKLKSIGTKDDHAEETTESNGAKSRGCKKVNNKSKSKVAKPMKDAAKCKSDKGSQESVDPNREVIAGSKSLSNSTDDKSIKNIKENSTSNNDKKSQVMTDNLKNEKSNVSDKPVTKSRTRIRSQSKTPGPSGDGDEEVQTNEAKISSQSNVAIKDNKARSKSNRSKKRGEEIQKHKRTRMIPSVNVASNSKTVRPIKDSEDETNEKLEITTEMTSNYKRNENVHSNDHQLSKQSKAGTLRNECEEQRMIEMEPSLKTMGKGKNDENETLHCDKLCSRSCESETAAANVIEEGNSMELESETSEAFDRYILDNISDEGLTGAALKSIHDKFPHKSLKMIADRGQQLLSLLESMSDEPSDVEDMTM